MNHGLLRWARIEGIRHGCIRDANGAAQNKNSASKLDRFLLFSANPSLLGSSVPIRDIRGYFLSKRAAPIICLKLKTSLLLLTHRQRDLPRWMRRMRL